MSDYTKGELEIVQVSVSTYQIWAKPKPNRKAILVASNINEDDAKELVRRWNAFEKDGLVDELKKACKKAKDELGGFLGCCGEDEKKDSFCGFIETFDLCKAAIAKVS